MVVVGSWAMMMLMMLLRLDVSVLNRFLLSKLLELMRPLKLL